MDTPTVTIIKILVNIILDFVGSILFLVLGIAFVRLTAFVFATGLPWLIVGFIILICLFLSGLMAMIFKR